VNDWKREKDIIMNSIVTKIMNKILPSCKEVSQLTSQAMDERLPLSKRISLKMHLEWCRRNAEQIRLMRCQAQEQAKEQNNSERLSSEAQKRIADSLKKNDPNQ
jgi:uncharacterized protein with von Willebrand factor type A (vWA) domain